MRGTWTSPSKPHIGKQGFVNYLVPGLLQKHNASKILLSLKLGAMLAVELDPTLNGQIPGALRGVLEVFILS